MNAKEIKHIREELLRLSQEDFARLLSVSVKTISRWENNESKPTGLSLDTLQKLSLIVRDSTYRKDFISLLSTFNGIALGTSLISLVGGLITSKNLGGGALISKLIDKVLKNKK